MHEIHGLESDGSIFTIAKPVGPVVGWKVPRAHRDTQPSERTEQKKEDCELKI